MSKLMFSRKYTSIINWFLDNLLPPVFRDNKLFMYLMFYPLFKDKTDFFINFRNNLYKISNQELRKIYYETKNAHLNRITDLHPKAAEYILKNTIGDNVLDIACGNGYMCDLLKNEKKIKNVVGGDIIIPNFIKENIHFIQAEIENLPFKNNNFNTVISAHTLEHIINIKKAVKELRRICKDRLIIVLPKQREYRFTFDLHIHFFPYDYNVLNLFQPDKNIKWELKLYFKDWVYIETY